MFERISNDIKEAMKAKDKVRLDALRMLKSRLIENKTSKAPQPEMDVVISHHKKLGESFEMFPEGSEHRDKLKLEMAVVSEYMPKPLNEDEVKALIKRIVQEQAGANFGVVMRSLTPEIKGRFDGKRASELVKSMMEG